MVEILNMLGLSGLAAAIPVTILFLTIRRDLKAASRDREKRIHEDAVWRTNIERDIQSLREDVHRLVRKLNGD